MANHEPRGSQLSARNWIIVTLLAALIAGTGSHFVQILITPGAIPPIGTIVAYHGLVNDIPDGWALCDGSTLPDGTELPDLTGRFIRGTTAAGLQSGGSATHAHRWAERGSRDLPGQWYSYLGEGGDLEVVDNWNNGIGNDGEGFPLLVDKETRLFTSTEEALPPYVELRFIMRVR